MEGVELFFFFLPRVDSPALAAIQKRADHACLLDLQLDASALFCQIVLWSSPHDGSTVFLMGALISQSKNKAGGNGAQVCEANESQKYGTADRDRGQSVDILAHDYSLLGAHPNAIQALEPLPNLVGILKQL